MDRQTRLESRITTMRERDSTRKTTFQQTLKTGFPVEGNIFYALKVLLKVLGPNWQMDYVMYLFLYAPSQSPYAPYIEGISKFSRFSVTPHASLSGLAGRPKSSKQWILFSFLRPFESTSGRPMASRSACNSLISHAFLRLTFLGART
jgi:hypothetical protein